MVDKIAEDLYRIEVPLPPNLSGTTNAYVVKSPNRNLIIDTGLNVPLCKDAMEKGLRELSVDVEKTDFFITHFHIDHLGLVSELVTPKSTIFFSRADLEAMKDERLNNTFLPDIREFSLKSGFPESDLVKVYNFFHGYDRDVKENLPFRLLEDGHEIVVVDYRFRCVQTPGHSKGHMCLYDPARRLLFSGDHLLGDITPTIQGRFNDENRLNDYLMSLDKVYELDVELVLPGHRALFGGCRSRIEELKAHHQKRNEEIIVTLEKGGADAYHVASHATWNTDSDVWDDFQPLQKFLAVGETISHLRYLEEKGTVRKEMKGQTIIYFLTDSR